MTYLTITNIIFLVGILILVRMLASYRASRRTLYRLMNHTNIGYYKYRCRDGVLIDANKGFADIIELGLDRKELVGRSLSELIIYVDGEESFREKIKKHKYLRNYEYHFKTLDGKDKWMMHNSYILKDRRTGEQIIEAWVEDVTEEMLSYEKMRKSQQRYEKLFRNSGDMVVIYRLGDGAVMEVNPQTEAISGHTKDELIGKPVRRLLHPLYREQLEDYERDLLFGGTAHLETVLVRKNGLYREISMTLSMSEDETDRIIIAVARDISAIIKEREEQDRRKDELDKLWKASIEREERIKDLRLELRQARQHLELLKGKKSDAGKKTG